MRLRRLDLTRYGKFTDRSIDFGPKPSAGPDLHVVFGLNEAGKSTALSGFLDLLFGIEERSRYAFLHEYASMRVGGILELDGQERGFVRTKQRTNSLLDANGQPAGELALSSHLAGLDRHAYGTMFSLDDETLEDGGRAILESKGDLGRLLFTASAGIAGASETLEALETEAGSLYRKQAQNTDLAILKKQLAELKAARDAIDTLASTYEALELERRDATEKYDRAVEERSIMMARRDAIARLEHAIPLLADHRRIVARLSELPSISAPTRTWTRSVHEMVVADADIAARLDANQAELERLENRQGEILTDELILAASERIRALSERKARHVSAGLDLPARRTELRILDNDVAAILAAIGRTAEKNPRDLLLPAATTSVVRTLFEQRAALTVGTRSARDEHASAVEALQAARERISAERAVPAASRTRLDAVRAQAQDPGHSQALTEATRQVDENAAIWASALLRLHPWTGDGAALSAVKAPTLRQVAAWRELLVERRTERASLVARLQEQQGLVAALLQQQEALLAKAKVPDDEAAASTRSARDLAWKVHRGALDDETADAFASILAQDDAIGAARLANAQDLEELRFTRSALADAEAQKTQIEKALAHVDAGLLELTEEMRSSIADLGGSLTEIAQDKLLETIEDLLKVRADALNAWARIEVARNTLLRLAEAEAKNRSDLMTVLGRVGIVGDGADTLHALLGIADDFLARQSKLDAEHEAAQRTIQTREEELAGRKRALEAAERREQEWLDEINDALAGSWLANGLPAAAVGTVLEHLSALGRSLQDRDAMGLRIQKMEADQHRFIEEVRGLAQECVQAFDEHDPEQAATTLVERLEAAERSKAALIAVADDRRSLLDGRDRLLGEQALLSASRLEILTAYGVETLEEVAEREAVLKERDRLRIQRDELEGRLVSSLRAESMTEAEVILAGIDEEALAVERLDLEQRIENSNEAIKEHLVRQTRAHDKLDAIGSDSAVARLDAKRRTILLEIEEKAERYIELRLGILAASNALRVYRDRHRSAMMTKASEAFSLMTQGQYTGLATQPGKAGEVLIAMAKDGSSKVADALSKGARFQLYLALRLAGYYEFAQVRSPVPFIADDIMETFDHLRSEEVFRLFGEIANVGQIIYLTHHRHLCDIARQVVPGVKVHELDAAGVLV